MKEKYQNVIDKNKPILEQLKRKENIAGWIKFAVIAGLIAPSVCLAMELWIAGGVLFVAAFAAIVVIVGVHNGLRKQVDYHQGILQIYEAHINRIDGKWTSFSDIGEEYCDTAHAYSSDLDIVGNKSLFQFLNTTDTWHGRELFAKDLLDADYSEAELKARQEAVSELSEDIEASAEIQYFFSKVGTNKNIPKLVEELKSKEIIFMANDFARWLLLWIPFLILAIVGVVIVWNPPILGGIIMVAILINLVACFLGWHKSRRYFGSMTKLAFRLGAYGDTLKVLCEKKFSCGKLRDIQDKLKDAEVGIGKLDSVSSMIKNSGLVINVLLWWNYRCAFALQKWKQKYRDQIEGWLLALGEFESLLALSHLPNICAEACLPETNENGGIIGAKELGHPLLPNEKRVNNDLEFVHNILIISGSNMSGKTTFLRTIGINIVLARAGGFVCAKKFNATLFNIMTSMRIADDLNEGVSTFYAELKRIKGIIDFCRKPNTLFLIDEIFRGTNSVDRLSGATMVMKELEKMGAYGLISTHDLELCALSKIHKRIINLHFCEHYKNKQIHFDYKLKNGKSTTTNAKHLMEMVGIITK